MEIQQIEAAIMVLAKAIEDGRIDGILQEVKIIMGYIRE